MSEELAIEILRRNRASQICILHATATHVARGQPADQFFRVSDELNLPREEGLQRRQRNAEQFCRVLSWREEERKSRFEHGS